MDFGMIELQATVRQHELQRAAREGRRVRAVAPQGLRQPTARAVATLVSIVMLVIALALGGGLAEANADSAVTGGGGDAIGYVP